MKPQKESFPLLKFFPLSTKLNSCTEEDEKMQKSEEENQQQKLPIIRGELALLVVIVINSLEWF